MTILKQISQSQALALVSPQPVKEYVSCADTAVELRKALKVAFPGFVFSVKSKTYSGGASITVSWTDGPTTNIVDRVAGQFAGATFDGSIDLKSYHESRYQGRLVHWGANFVFTNRHHSPELIDRACRYVEAKYGHTPIDRANWHSDYRPLCQGSAHYQHVSDQMHRTLSQMRGDGLLIVRVNS